MATWSHAVYDASDGTCRVDVTDEQGACLPVARGLTRGQAALLMQRLGAEAATSQRQIAAVIRDPWFMAATILTVKRHAI